MGLFTDDLAAVYSDLQGLEQAVEVTIGSKTTIAIFDRGAGLATDESGLTVELDEFSLLIRTGTAFPEVQQEITVDAAQYRVRAVRPEPRDGLETRVVIVPVRSLDAIEGAPPL